MKERLRADVATARVEVVETRRTRSDAGSYVTKRACRRLVPKDWLIAGSISPQPNRCRTIRLRAGDILLSAREPRTFCVAILSCTTGTASRRTEPVLVEPGNDAAESLPEKSARPVASHIEAGVRYAPFQSHRSVKTKGQRRRRTRVGDHEIDRRRASGNYRSNLLGNNNAIRNHLSCRLDRSLGATGNGECSSELALVVRMIRAILRCAAGTVGLGRPR